MAEEKDLKNAEVGVQSERNICLRAMTDLTKHQIYKKCHNGDSSQEIDEYMKRNSALDKEISKHMQQFLNQEMQKSTHLEEVLKSKNTEIGFLKEEVYKIEQAHSEYEVVLPKEKNENQI